MGSKRGRHLVQDYEFLRCTECGYTRVEPFAGYGIYDEAYYEGRGADPFVNYAQEYLNHGQTDRILEFEDFERIAIQHFAKRAAGQEIAWLDFGCGAGGLLKYLRDRGGLELATGFCPLRLAGHDVGSYAERLKWVDGFSIFDEKTLSDMPDRSFDVITLIEVIEHVPQANGVIGMCARLLRPGGLLLVTTGNFDCQIARLHGINYRYCIPEIHVSLYSPKSLSALYRRHGLEPFEVAYDGAVRFKVLKSVRPLWRGLVRQILRLPGVLAMVDLAYGVSRMPCARRSFHD